jgi:hypothetical protein
MQVKEKKIVKKIHKLRSEKMTLGSLLRIVSGNKYENISDDLIEVEKLKKRVPQLKNFSGLLEQKRDLSRSKGRSRSPIYDNPAIGLSV